MLLFRILLSGFFFIFIFGNISGEVSQLTDVEPLYQATQHGFVGLNIYAPWFSPYSNATEDIIATQRAIDFYIGW